VRGSTPAEECFEFCQTIGVDQIDPGLEELLPELGALRGSPESNATPLLVGRFGDALEPGSFR